MRVVRQLEEAGSQTEPIFLAVGYFDGVHCGHQSVIGRAVDEARRAGGKAWVLTLDPHPAKILRPESAPPLITSTAHKIRLIEQLGVDGCIVLPFTCELAEEEAEHFIERLAAAIPSLKEVVVGQNWTFGHKARGDVGLLKKLAPNYGLSVTVVEPVLWHGLPVSSTRIRRVVFAGHLEDAAQMLSRRFSILGTVVRGKQFGRQIGFPTANLDPHNEVRPPSGVYATEVIVDGTCHPGALFLAGREEAQTSPSGLVVEVHILDFSGDLYGKDIEVFFIKRLREARHFGTTEELKSRIAHDVEQVRLACGQQKTFNA